MYAHLWIVSPLFDFTILATKNLHLATIFYYSLTKCLLEKFQALQRDIHKLTAGITRFINIVIGEMSESEIGFYWENTETGTG